MTLTRMLVAALAAAALAASPALAQPADIHAPLAKAAAEANKQAHNHDLRLDEAARDAARAARPDTAGNPKVAADAVARGDDSAKANVYVPPGAAVTDTVTGGDDSPASGPSWDLDWGSAGIGAGTAMGALLIALGGAVGLRRRRQIQPSVTG